MKAARLVVATLVAFVLGVAPVEARHGPVVAHMPTVTHYPPHVAVHFRATLNLPYRAHGATLTVCPRHHNGRIVESGCASTTTNLSATGTFLSVTKTVSAVEGRYRYWSVARASWIERTPRRKFRPGRENLRYHAAVSKVVWVTR